VDIPAALELSDCSFTQSQSPTYDLTAVTHHCGSLLSGHYWAHCRSAVDGQWYTCNDSSVQLDSRTEDGASDTPYLMLYRLRNTRGGSASCPGYETNVK